VSAAALALAVTLAAAGAAPTAVVDPSEAGPAPPRAHRTAPAPDAPTRTRAARPDLPALPLAGLQCATGCAVLAGALPLSFVCTVATCAGAPFLIGYFQTWVGDRLGEGRAPAIGPIAATYLGVGTTLAGIVVAFAAMTLVDAPTSTGQAVVAGTGAALLALTLGAGPLVYVLSASPKHALDDGAEPPDFFQARVPLDVKNHDG
jgi:hypothetical protein